MTPTSSPDSTAQDTVLRLAMGMWAADPTSSISDAQRRWVLARLQTLQALTVVERTKLQAPLLHWIAARHPRILAIVERQFAPAEEGV